jgi:hypothetical protein
MTNTFHLVQNNLKGSILTLPSHILKQTGIMPGNKKTLHFGTNSVEVEIMETNQRAWSLSQNSLDELLLPLEADFEFRLVNNEIIIGPFLGILAAVKEKNLIKKLKRLKKQLSDYNLVKGVIMAFSVEGIHEGRVSISGYVYNPFEKKWIKGVYPYPNAIYKRMPLKKKLLNHLKSQIGNKIFNEAIISKWRVYQLLAKEDELKPYLPYTKKYISPQEVLNLADSWQTVFLKPFNRSFGRGIYEIRLYNGNYTLRTRIKRENHNKIFGANELEAYLLNNIGRSRYILQQTLNLKFKNNRVIDYRLYLTKNHTGEWQCTGWIAKNGAPNSIVSNRSNGGTVEPADETLQKSFGLTIEEAELLKQKVFSIACKAADCLEKKSGKMFGYFGVDMALDTNKNIWIIEMNHRFVDDTLPLAIKDTELYRSIQTSYLHCLKYLSGF